MKNAQKIYGITILLFLSFYFLFLHYRRQQNIKSPIDFETQKVIDEKVAKFEYQCHLNEVRADSFAQVVNKKYNYPYRLKAHFKVDNKQRREMFSVYDVPFYGMTDGYNAFIFSLHRMKVKEISVHWGGFEDFWAFYEWDFNDSDEIMGWKMDLNIMDITIPEHEKVIDDIRKRVKKAEKEKESHNQIYFSDLDFSLIY